MSRDGLLSLASLGLALALALVLGSFLGWSSNPDRTAAFDAAHIEMARSGVSGSIEDLQKQQHELAQKHPGFDSPDPHTAIAILKTPLLLGVLSFGLLCVFRPSPLWTAAVFVPAAAVAFFAGLSAALSVLGAIALSIIWSVVYARLRKKVAP